MAVTAVSCAGSFDTPDRARQPRFALRCEYPEGVTVHTQTIAIGPEDTKVSVLDGRIKFDLPAGAVTSTTRVTIEEMEGDTVGFRITPVLTIEQPITVSIDVGSSRCRGVSVKRGDWSVWRRADARPALERLPTRRPWFRNRIEGKLPATSYIMIAD
ncbi:MAG TPA: hypothetical protein VMN60_11805 [Longimicrobiales bacterium]|nr:hypothetical protein [Longimicrobiales bacterium]